MAGSIDPRCEILRGTHWPVEVARLFGTRFAENHFGQGPTDRINRPDIWMQAIGSDPEKTLVARGPSTYGSPPSRGRHSEYPGNRVARASPICEIAGHEINRKNHHSLRAS